MKKCGLVWAVAFWSMAMPVQAAEFVEQFDRFEINWSNLRLRYYGEASGLSSEAGRKSYRDLERGAWQEGLSYAARSLPALYKDRIAANEAEAIAAAERLTRSTYSYNTIYFADGSVRVLLENVLPRTIDLKGIGFRQQSEPSIDHLAHTGVVFRIRGMSNPLATYKIVDQDHAVLFEPSDVAEEAFRRNLMGRWFSVNASGTALREGVGSQPIEMNATYLGDGRIEVSAADWREKVVGYEDLLKASRIALIILR